MARKLVKSLYLSARTSCTCTLSPAQLPLSHLPGSRFNFADFSRTIRSCFNCLCICSKWPPNFICVSCIHISLIPWLLWTWSTQQRVKMYHEILQGQWAREENLLFPLYSQLKFLVRMELKSIFFFLMPHTISLLFDKLSLCLSVFFDLKRKCFHNTAARHLLTSL